MDIIDSILDQSFFERNVRTLKMNTYQYIYILIVYIYIPIFIFILQEYIISENIFLEIESNRTQPLGGGICFKDHNSNCELATEDCIHMSNKVIFDR